MWRDASRGLRRSSWSPISPIERDIHDLAGWLDAVRAGADRVDGVRGPGHQHERTCTAARDATGVDGSGARRTLSASCVAHADHRRSFGATRGDERCELPGTAMPRAREGAAHRARTVRAAGALRAAG